MMWCSQERDLKEANHSELENIQKDVKASVGNMEETGEVVDSSFKSIKESRSAFEDIEHTAGVLSRIIRDINNKAKEMAAKLSKSLSGSKCRNYKNYINF